MSKELSDIELKVKLAGALEASIQEKYEVLTEIGNSMPEEDRNWFFEIVEILKPVYETKPAK